MAATRSTVPLSWYLSINSRKTREPAESFQWFPVAPGSSWMPGQTPGPGFYPVPSDSVYAINRFHRIQERPETQYSTLSSNIGFSEHRVFPALRPVTFGVRKELQYFKLEDTPSPNMPQPPTLPAQPVVIGNRLRKSLPDPGPGPGCYNPIVRTRPLLVLRMSRERARGNVFATTVSSPGPGTYDPEPPLDPPKRWTVRLMKVKPLPVIQLRRRRGRGRRPRRSRGSRTGCPESAPELTPVLSTDSDEDMPY
jgi:hypothetical protein